MEVNEGAGTSQDLGQISLVKESDILPGCSNFDDFLQTAYPFVMNGVKSSNYLPANKEFSYYSTYPKFKDSINDQEQGVQNLMQKLLKYCGSKRTIAAQCPDDKFDLIIDINDIILGRAANNLKELDAKGRNAIALNNDFGEGNLNRNISGSWNKTQLSNTCRRHDNATISRQNLQSPRNNIIKPQIYFKDKIDNRNETWVPKISEKPNALKPLSILLSRDEKDVECYTHPYDYELTLFKISEERLSLTEKPSIPKPMSKTPLIMIEEESQLKGLIDDLHNQQEIAVDLEHHSFRSFMGITCLLQISTREKDYLIDTLSLRHVLYKLNEVFTKPTILKIFHGADSDVEWLQRDLGVYVVNMFDTYHAAKMLSYPKLGLSYLLKKFCNIESDKRFQLYDWRIRPLPESAKNYARNDTHYLIYIYERMNNELIIRTGGQSNFLNAVFQRSTATCKRIYHKPLLTEDSYMTLYRKSKRHFDSRQLYALKEIYKWRDTVAREEDESSGYILSNHMMMQICQTLPREVQGILACCNPIPPAVKQHLITLHNIVLKAKEQPLVKAIIEEPAKPASQFSASRDFDIEAKISTYIHDNAGLEFRDDYPTLLGQLKSKENSEELITDNIPSEDSSELNNTVSKLPLMVNTVDEFVSLDRRDSSKKTEANIEEITTVMKRVKFITPYQRYKQVLPYSRKLEDEERERERIEEEKNQERLLKTQYNIRPPQGAETVIRQDQENGVESQEKENTLKRPLEIKAEPLSTDNPGKKKRMLQKFDVCEPKDDISLLTAKRETSDPVGSTNEGSVGVVGGELSLTKRSFDRSGSRHQKKHQEFTPYDYRRVDFSKFQSNSSASNRVPSDSKFKGKIKRNTKFQGRHHYGNRKRGKNN